MNSIPVHMAVEDDLSETILRVMLKQTKKPYAVGSVYGRRGFGDLKRMAPGFNKASQFAPFILLTDLDKTECAPALIREWLGGVRCPNFVFRVAVREVEAWVLAHRRAFASLCGLRTADIPTAPDDLSDPKRELIKLVARSRFRRLKGEICPPQGSSRTQGPGYNMCLAEFVMKHWRAEEAARYSPSLARAFARLKRFEPTLAPEGGNQVSE